MASEAHLDLKVWNADASKAETSGLRLPKEIKVRKLPEKEKIALFTGLSRLLRGGIAMLQALDLLGATATQAATKQILLHLRSSVADGKSLSTVMQAHPRSFGPFEVAIVKVGEETGRLEDNLAFAATHIRRIARLRAKFIEAITYPVFVVVVAIITMIVMMYYIVPKITDMYADLEATLPMLTQMCLATVQVLKVLLPIGIVAALALSLLRIKGQSTFVTLLRQAPGVRPVLQGHARTLLFRTLSTLLDCGLMLPRALMIATDTLQDPRLRSDMQTVTAGINQGSSLSACLGPLAWVPGPATALITAGEESGALPETLQQIALDEEEAVTELMQQMLKLLEPLLIVGCGLFIGLIVIATLLPLLNMSSYIS